MALSIKLAQRIPLPLFINILLAQSGMSATPLVFFFHFGVCVVYVCGIYTCAHACMGAHVHAESRRGISGS